MVEDTTKKGGGGDGESIRVFVRVRPQSSEGLLDHATCLNVASNTSLVMNSKPQEKVFTFDMVAPPEATQETMFNAVGKNLIDSCLSGYNGTIFAYGQTGSGKTFTMLGPSEDSDNFLDQLRGIIPRSFEYLFSLIQRQKELHGDNVEFLCKCSFLEIYNENIFDMLDSASSHSLQLRENIKKGVFVDGLIEQTVGCAADAYQVLTAGWMNRTVASTSMNRESSRSHAVFSVLIESKELKNGVWNMKSSQMNLVDLAGSERQKDTKTTGLRLKEGCQINKSLSALGNVIMALVDITHGKSRFVPYRDSKLSFLLRDSLGGNAKTHIIACVHPGSKCFGETLSTLQFARRAKMIKNKAVINENAAGSIEGLQQEILRLKEELRQYESGSIPPAISSSDGDGPPSENAVLSGDGAYWRTSFLQAMYFVMKGREDHKILQEKYLKSEENYKRKDQALRQTKLVLKFRDEGLKKIERAQKEQRAELTKDEKDFIIESLRAEVKTLSSIVEHHPDLPKVHGENDMLKQQLQRIKSQGAVADNIASDQHHSAQLEKMYKDMLNEKEKDGELRTPSKETAIDVNGLKNQIEKLQTELEALRQQSSEQISKLEKTLVNKEAELVSSQTVREELERTLKSHHIRTQIERETTQQLHMDTIKTITTPKKAKYNLRNRLILAPDSGTAPIGPLDLETSAEEELLDDMAPPPEYEEERVIALTDELRKQQDAFNVLKDDCNKREEEMLRMVENTSRLESQKTQFEVLLTREQAKAEDLQLQITTLNKSFTQQEEQFNMAKGEVEDLRIMWKQSEKLLSEGKIQLQQAVAAKDSEISALQTRTVQIELDLNQTKHRLESSEEEVQQLRDVVENLEASKNFTEENLKQSEEMVQEKLKEKESLQSELNLIRVQLQEQQEKTQQLRTQLEISGVKEKELSEAYAQMDKIRAELKESQSLNDSQNTRIQDLVHNVREVTDALFNAEKLSQERQDTINSLITKTDDLRDLLKENVHTIESLSTQLVEGHERTSALESANQQLEDKLQQECDSRQAQVTELETQIQQRLVELDLLKDEHDDLSERYGAMVNEVSAAHDQAEKLETEITGLKQQVKDKESDLVNCRTEWEEKLHAVEERIDVKDSAVAKLHAELDAKANEINRLRVRQNELAKINEQNTFSIMDKNQKIEHLKMKEVECQELHAQFDMLQIENQSLIYQIEELEMRSEQRVSDLQDEVASLRSLASHHDDEIAMTTQQRDKVRKEVGVLQESVEMMCAELVETREMMERYQVVAAKDLEEKGKLLSENEEFKAHDLLLKKEICELKKRCEDLYTENATLSGHHNLNQRIHYVQNLKDTVIQAGEELRVTKAELTRCQALLKAHSIPVTPMKVKAKSVLTPQKVTVPAPLKLTVTPQKTESKALPLRPHNTNETSVNKDAGPISIKQEASLPQTKQETLKTIPETTTSVTGSPVEEKPAEFVVKKENVDPATRIEFQ